MIGRPGFVGSVIVPEHPLRAGYHAVIKQDTALP